MLIFNIVDAFLFSGKVDEKEFCTDLADNKEQNKQFA